MLGIILAPFGKIPGAYPSEIGFSYGGNGSFLCPEDPFYNTRGEVGFYHDTQLGGLPMQADALTPNTLFIPNQPALKQKLGLFGRMRANRVARALNGLGSVPSDFDLQPTYGWVPMIDGWVQGREGFSVGGWVPPNGWSAAGGYGPPMGPPAGVHGLGDATIVVPAPTVQSTSADPISAAATAAAGQIQDTLQAQNDRMFKLTIISTTIVGLSALIATLRTWKQLKRDEALFNSRLR
jgi:hypothetical protein